MADGTPISELDFLTQQVDKQDATVAGLKDSINSTIAELAKSNLTAPPHKPALTDNQIFGFGLLDAVNGTDTLTQALGLRAQDQRAVEAQRFEIAKEQERARRESLAKKLGFDSELLKGAIEFGKNLREQVIASGQGINLEDLYAELKVSGKFIVDRIKSGVNEPGDASNPLVQLALGRTLNDEAGTQSLIDKYAEAAKVAKTGEGDKPKGPDIVSIRRDFEQGQIQPGSPGFQEAVDLLHPGNPDAAAFAAKENLKEFLADKNRKDRLLGLAEDKFVNQKFQRALNDRDEARDALAKSQTALSELKAQETTAVSSATKGILRKLFKGDKLTEKDLDKVVKVKFKGKEFRTVRQLREAFDAEQSLMVDLERRVAEAEGRLAKTPTSNASQAELEAMFQEIFNNGGSTQ